MCATEKATKRAFAANKSKRNTAIDVVDAMVEVNELTGAMRTEETDYDQQGSTALTRVLCRCRLRTTMGTGRHLWHYHLDRHLRTDDHGFAGSQVRRFARLIGRSPRAPSGFAAKQAVVGNVDYCSLGPTLQFDGGGRTVESLRHCHNLLCDRIRYLMRRRTLASKK
jgi:hypothetical protein